MSVKRRKRIQKIGLEKMPEGIGHVLTEWTSHGDGRNRVWVCQQDSPVLRGINSESVELIYLDPPFNSNRTYSAPIGSKAAGAAFKDTWTRDDVDDAEHGLLAEQHPSLYHAVSAAKAVHGDGMFSYLIMMGSRLLEMKRVLKPNGSIYLHCDPTANAYLRMITDAVFGPANLRNEIVWCYRGGGVPKLDFARKHDTIFRYCKGGEVTFKR